MSTIPNSADISEGLDIISDSIDLFPDETTGQPTQAAPPAERDFPTVNFLTPPLAANSLTRRHPTSMLNHLASFATAPLRNFINRALQFYNDHDPAALATNQAAQQAQLATLTTRVAMLEQNLAAAQTSPAVIPDDHPQLVAANDALTEANQQLAVTIAQNEQLTNQLAAAHAAAQGATAPAPTLPVPEITPAQSASNVQSQMLYNPNVSNLSLTLLSEAINATTAQGSDGQPPFSQNNYPSSALLAFARDVARFSIGNNHRQYPQQNRALSAYYQPQYLIAPDSVDQVHTLNTVPERHMYRIIGLHSVQDRTLIASNQPHVCPNTSTFCLIRHLESLSTQESSQPARSTMSAYYVLAITDNMSPRRYPLTMFDLLARVQGHSAQSVILEITRRAPDYDEDIEEEEED